MDCIADDIAKMLAEEAGKVKNTKAKAILESLSADMAKVAEQNQRLKESTSGNNKDPVKDPLTKAKIDQELNKKIETRLKELYPEINLTYTNEDISYRDLDYSTMNQEEYNNKVGVTLKLIDSLYDMGTAKVSKHGGESQPIRRTVKLNTKSSPNIERNLTKHLAGKGVPSEQIELMFDYMKQNDIVEISTLELAEKLLFGINTVVEVNTTTKEVSPEMAKRNKRTLERLESKLIRNKDKLKEIESDRIDDPYYNEMGYRRLLTEISKIEGDISRLENESEAGKVNTKDYAGLTVPGGINYKEVEISTPGVDVVKKGHAEFATDEGIGWYRVDDYVSGGEYVDIPSSFTDKGGQLWEKKDEIWYATLPGENIEKRDDLGDSEMRKIYEGFTGTKNGKTTKTLRVLEMQSDMFQQMKDEKVDETEDMDNGYFNENGDFVGNTKRVQNKSFHQLLNTNNKWVKFFIQSLIQDAKHKGYENIRFPNGDTVGKVEGYTKEHKSQAIMDFYDTKVKNTLIKTYGKSNIVEVTDEYGNKWFELKLDKDRDSQNIMFQKSGARIKGQADLKAKTVLIDERIMTQDTLPHEYAHHYIGMFRETEIVQEGIKKWGSEERLVQAIGEQSVKQKGDAWNWFKQFSKWIQNKFNKLDSRTKEELRDILTDAFLTKVDLNINPQESSVVEINIISKDTQNTEGKPTSGFQGYVGGFNTKGKGEVQGDGKDKAMREMADGFIGEAAIEESSTITSYVEIAEKTDEFDEGSITYPYTAGKNPKTVMLAKNSPSKYKKAGRPELADKLLDNTKRAILKAHKEGATFVVGDMSGVDSQFIDYLDEIEASYKIYHTDNIRRIKKEVAKQEFDIVMPSNTFEKNANNTIKC